MAVSFTGGNCISFPLPFGLSGWVTARHTSCPAATRASRVPTEKSGVPINITRIVLLLRFLFFLIIIGHIMESVLCLIYIQLSVKMVDLMAECPRQKPLAFHLKRLHILVQGTHLHALRPGHDAPFSRH